MDCQDCITFKIEKNEKMASPWVRDRGDRAISLFSSDVPFFSGLLGDSTKLALSNSYGFDTSIAAITQVRNSMGYIKICSEIHQNLSNPIKKGRLSNGALTLFSNCLIPLENALVSLIILVCQVVNFNEEGFIGKLNILNSGSELCIDAKNVCKKAFKLYKGKLSPLERQYKLAGLAKGVSSCANASLFFLGMIWKNALLGVANSFFAVAYIASKFVQKIFQQEKDDEARGLLSPSLSKQSQLKILYLL